jgi:hypothetical protein
VPDDIPAPVATSISITEVLVKAETALKSEQGINTSCQEVVMPLGRMVPVKETAEEIFLAVSTMLTMQLAIGAPVVPMTQKSR